MAIAQYNIIFNCTPAQFATVMSTTLPAVGIAVIQAPIQFQGIARFTPFTLTGTTSTSINVTAVSSFAGLYVGLPVSGTGIQPGTTIATLNPGAATLTLSLATTTTTVGDIITATPPYAEIDFSYDGQFFLRFFDSNMTPAVISELSAALLALLGAPVPSAIAVPPYSTNLI